MIKSICIMLLIVFIIFGWCMFISSKRRDKAWNLMKGKTIRPKTNDADKRSESVNGKEKEGSQIYKTDLH